MNVLIRNVSEAKWRKFKAEAASRGLTVGKLFNDMVDDYVQKQDTWDYILNGPQFLSEKEAKDMEAAVKEFRDGFVFDDPFLYISTNRYFSQAQKNHSCNKEVTEVSSSSTKNSIRDIQRVCLWWTQKQA